MNNTCLSGLGAIRQAYAEKTSRLQRLRHIANQLQDFNQADIFGFKGSGSGGRADLPFHLIAEGLTMRIVTPPEKYSPIQLSHVTDKLVISNLVHLPAPHTKEVHVVNMADVLKLILTELTMRADRVTVPE